MQREPGGFDRLEIAGGIERLDPNALGGRPVKAVERFSSQLCLRETGPILQGLYRKGAVVGHFNLPHETEIIRIYMVARARYVYEGRSAQGVAQHDRCGQQDDGAGLVRGSERDRHDQQQGRDAERYLHRCCGEQCPQSDASRGGEGGAKAGGPQQQHRGGGRHRQQAMVELNRRDVFEPVADEGCSWA